ncbi:MAG TPA: SDR family NAD(P)-dependent oxidoreductase [Polyangiaceae bacterium]|nr:SDR family NAD(P)-dependent oxidoreductase [Polyangiaceae bacterium]
MANELRFDGRVAVITGAGGGLGRAYALLLAARGARVVVNDLGGAFKGGGASSEAADKVVAEIKAAGGTAVANYDSVEQGDKIVQTALDSFGQLDIIVNNAGILRDVTFQKMTHDDWDMIRRVHLDGAFKVTHAAWPHLRDRKYGRIINTSSAAGIYGNFGQVNYATAKLGLVGFTYALALEGKKNNVHVNAIAPIAGSRMTETVLPPDLLEALKPEYVASLVAWLCHEDCDETGGLFEVGGGYYAKLRRERARGKTFRLGKPVSPEALRAAWGEVTSFERAEHPDSINASMEPVLSNVSAGPGKGGNEFIDVDQALGYEYPEVRTSYDERDLALYALAVGAAKDPLDQAGLGLVYERHGEGFKPLPTYAVVPALAAVFKLAEEGKSAPGLNFGFDRILHGEQALEILAPLPPKAKLSHRARVKAIYDKGKHALVVTEIRTFDDAGRELARNETTTFIRGAGGWGGERGPSNEGPGVPERAPDQTREDQTAPNQALLYRLTGDWNPLHADPGFAQGFGFERPILHGLCTYGFAGRHLVEAFAPKRDPRYLKSMRARFADSVFPGETLVTEMWKDGETGVRFQVRAKERNKIVLSGGHAEFFRELPKEAPKPAAAPAQGPAAAPGKPTSAGVFAAIGQHVAAHPELAAKIKKVFQFRLSDPDSVWTLDLQSNSVAAGETAAAQCTLAMTDADFVAMASGQADAMKLFSTGKLKISGDVMASQKLGFLKDVDLKSASAPAAAPAPAAAAGGPSSAGIFAAIGKHVASKPEIAAKVKKVFQFRLSGPDSVWTLNLQDAPGSVAEGETAPAQCTLSMSDADFVAMASGQADAMKLFSTGKLKISGDVMASQKLGFLKDVDVKSAASAPAPAAAPKAAAAAPKAAAEPAAPKVFAALAKRLAEAPALARELDALVQIKVAEPDARWVIDARKAPATVAEGESNDAVATVTLRDEDLAELARGASAQTLYQRGRLRVDGDVRVAHRLGLFKGLI